MAPMSNPDSARAEPAKPSRRRALSLKAASFALVGVVNTVVDYGLFLLVRELYTHWPAALAAFGMVASACRCGEPDSILLVAANMTSWVLAVSGSYVMNSSITFAAESGRRLRWRDYRTFVIAGIAGLIANTATLVFVVQVLTLPVWVAKGVAILASFVVNFSMSHFIVFRVRDQPVGDARDGG